MRTEVLREGRMIMHEQSVDEQEAWTKMMFQPSMDGFRKLSPDSERLISLLDEI
jgi:hypothetical protein